MSDDVKKLLQEYNVVVYELSRSICSIGGNIDGSISSNSDEADYFCGSAEERVPASVFRYYMYEKWAAIYNVLFLIIISHFLLQSTINYPSYTV